MSIQTEPDYLNVDKNRWRLDKWAAIRQLVSKTRKAKDAVVIYLPGPKDLDRDVAVSMGFRSYNLIGIDLDAKIVSDNRKRSKYGVFIQGRLEDLIANLPKDFDIAAIDADLCCGLQGPAHALMRCLITDVLIPRDIVVSINLQRGRDANSNHVRNLIGGARAKEEALKNSGLDLQKHRGVNFMLEAFMAVEHNYSLKGEGDSIIDMLMPRPWFLNSYKSNRVFMDSLVVRWRTTHIQPMPLTGAPDQKRNRALWAAARATRTRYMNEIMAAHQRRAA